MQCYNVGIEIVISALIYIERLLTANPGMVLTENNIKGLLHASLSLSAKFFCDNFEKNTIFYACNGLPKKRMRAMLDLYLDLI
jgi:hypothetical protein